MKQSRDVMLVAGSANIDVVVRAVHVPAPGETVLGRDLAVCPEGPASLSLPCAVVMLGSRGGCARDQDTSYLQPTFWIEAVNTTAAGDTFCGALASSLCAAIPLPQASRRASAAQPCRRRGSSRSRALRRATRSTRCCAHMTTVATARWRTSRRIGD